MRITQPSIINIEQEILKQEQQKSFVIPLHEADRYCDFGDEINEEDDEW